MAEAVPHWRHRLAAVMRKGAVTAAIAMFARVSSQIALVGVTLVATRMLTPTAFGVFAIAAALLTLARTMLYTGPFEYLLKAPEDGTPHVARACLLVNFVAALAWLVLLGAAGLAAPRIFGSPAVGAVILALAPSNLVAAYTGWLEALLLRSGRLRPYYAITVTVEFVSGIGAALLLVAGCGLWALVAQVYMRLLLFVAVYVLIVRAPSPGWAPPGVAREVLRWSGGRYGSVLVGFLGNYSGDLLLGAVFSPAAAGVYRAGSRIVTALADVFVQPAGLLTATTLSAARARGEARRGAWLRLLALFGAPAFSALALLALLADRLTPIVLGPAWAAAAPVVAIFCVARMAALLTAVASAVLVVEDRQGRLLWVQGVAAVATAGLTIAAASAGAIAAALVTTLVAAVMAAVLLRDAWLCDVPTMAESRRDALRSAIIPLVGAFGAAGGMTLALRGAGDGVLPLACALAAGVAGWGLAAWYVGPELRRTLSALADGPAPAE
ncbi:MAG: hypothetical protein RIS94_2145 [Pseudomonadota bacterium]|jgi:O-antigen/teichoic acid export membrane protein